MIIPYEPDYYPPSSNPVIYVGRNFLKVVRHAGRGIIMVAEAFIFLPLILRSREEVARQMFLSGIKSFGVTSVVALFTGMILSLQSGLILRDYGQEMRVGTLVAEAMCREMGPIMTALILSASVGSAIAAQLGTMAVSEEIAALEVMSINPVRFLVMPRLAAMMIMCPVLTVYTDFIGIIGGGAVAESQLNVSWGLYYENVLFMLGVKEIWIGILKSWVFAIIIVGISCYEGLSATKGAIGVGIATRSSVVISFLLVLVSGYFLTRFFY